MMDRKHRGTRAELLAITFLLKEGYEVFRNVSPHGLIDIVAIKGGVSAHFDVKTAQITPDGGKRLTARLSLGQVSTGVKCINVYDDDVVVIDWNPQASFKHENRECSMCGHTFRQTNARHLFCTPKCRHAYFQSKNGDFSNVRSI